VAKLSDYAALNLHLGKLSCLPRAGSLEHSSAQFEETVRGRGNVGSLTVVSNSKSKSGILDLSGQRQKAQKGYKAEAKEENRSS